MFKEELDYFIKNQDMLVKEYKGKILILHGKSVYGVYDNIAQAYKKGKEELGLGSFMIQPCISGIDAYTVTINSSGVANY